MQRAGRDILGDGIEYVKTTGIRELVRFPNSPQLHKRVGEPDYLYVNSIQDLALDHLCTYLRSKIQILSSRRDG